MKYPVPGAANIPDKKYFRIGEVSNLVGVDTHVLRYWETEFTFVKPHRAQSKQRLYRRKDVENLLLIKTLLHDEGYTISGARRLLKSGRRQDPQRMQEEPLPDSKDRLSQIKGELETILARLADAKQKDQ